MLIETATGLPAGLDSEVEIAVCDSTNMTVANNVDVSDWAELNTADGTARRTFVIVRAHIHPDDKPKTMRASTADVDDELQRMLDNEPPSGG